MARWLGAALLALSLLVAVGCGEDEGVAEDAFVSVYVGPPLGGTGAPSGGACAMARAELARNQGRAGDVRVRAVCVAAGDGSALAAIGAGARRAVEDSSSVAYLAVADPRAARFSRTIVAAAGIPLVVAPSGAAAMARVLGAIEAAGDGGRLREEVATNLEANPGG